MTSDFLQGTAGIHGRSGLPGRKGEQVRVMFVIVKKVAVFLCAYLLFVVCCIFKGEIGPSGPAGVHGKEGLVGPKVCVCTIYACTVCMYLSMYASYINRDMSPEKSDK